MSASGYTRQSLANIQPSLTINAEDLNLEFNQVQSAFDNTLGHDHSGASPGTGQKINMGASVSGILPVANGGTGVMASTGTGKVMLNIAPVVSGGMTVSGGVTVIDTGITVSAGGGTIKAGGLTVSAGGVFDGAGARVVSNSNKFALTTGAAAGTLTTTSLTGVMMGYGSSITIVPNVTGRIMITVHGMISNGTANDGVQVTSAIGTGTAPVNGAALVGTFPGFVGLTNNANTNSAFFPFSVTGVATSLTVGVTYWLDVVLAAVTGGTASIQNVRITAYEI